MEKNISNALDAMLRAFNCENCKEAVIDEIAMNGWAPKQLTKTRFKFWFIGRPLGIFASTFIFSNIVFTFISSKFNTFIYFFYYFSFYWEKITRNLPINFW